MDAQSPFYPPGYGVPRYTLPGGERTIVFLGPMPPTFVPVVPPPPTYFTFDEAEPAHVVRYFAYDAEGHYVEVTPISAQKPSGPRITYHYFPRPELPPPQ